MSTSAVGQRERDRDDRVRGENVRLVGIDETKVAFKTTEFLAYLATVVGVLIAAAVDETIARGWPGSSWQLSASGTC